MLSKQSLNINFASGLNTKADAYQVPAGQFLSLNNAVFDELGALKKRNGFGSYSFSPGNANLFLSTYDQSLVALGTKLDTFSPATNIWVESGNFFPASVSNTPVSRSAHNQYAQDCAISGNVACFVYVDNGIQTYLIRDLASNTTVIPPTSIPSAATVSLNNTQSAKVYVLGAYFIILYYNSTSGNFLNYCAIQISNPYSVTFGHLATVTPFAFDAVIIGSTLYASYIDNIGSFMTVHVYAVTLTSGLTVGTPTLIAAAPTGNIAPRPFLNSVLDAGSNIIYMIVGAQTPFFDSNIGQYDDNLFIAAMNTSLVSQFSPQLIVKGTGISSATGTATSGSLTFFYTDSAGTLKKNTCSSSGTVGTAASMNLFFCYIASKATIYNSNSYFVIQTFPSSFTSNFLFQTPTDKYSLPASYQPTYFLINQLGQVVSEMSYSNAGGIFVLDGTLAVLCPSSILSSLTLTTNTVSFAGLFKDIIVPVNSSQATTATGAFFSQAGVNLYTVNQMPSAIQSSEIANNLHVSGGKLQMFDGINSVEHGFAVVPEITSVSYLSKQTFTATVSYGSNVLTAVSDFTYLRVGMIITGPGFGGFTVPVIVTALNPGASTLTINNAANANNVGGTYTPTALTAQTYFYQACYSWMDAQGNIHRSAPSIVSSFLTSGPTAAPALFITVSTLGLTAKSNVVIELYRYSANQPIYYLVTSISAPLLNDRTQATVTFTDLNQDADIIGNLVLYTTGGVLPNDAAPATSVMTLWNSRMFLVDDEDHNRVWFSKPVIETVPVEFSSAFTIFANPTIGAQTTLPGISALFGMDDKLILFRRDSIAYITGQGPDITGANNGFSDPIAINSTVGCTSPGSLALIPSGLIFKSDKGIWLLGRDLSTNYIGAPVEGYNSFDIVSALVIPGTNQVRFTLSSGVILMYDYFVNQWGAFSVSAGALSSVLYNGLHTYLGSGSHIYQETPGTYADNTTPVTMSFTTAWLNIAGLQGYQRAYQFFVLGKYASPHQQQWQIAYDYETSPSQATAFTPVSTDTEQWRVFLDKQKCESIQLTFNELSTTPGPGLTMSGVSLIAGVKKAYRTQSAAKSTG